MKASWAETSVDPETMSTFVVIKIFVECNDNILLDLGKKVCDTFSREEMILTKILRAADHPYLMGKGGRMVIQIIIMIITVTKMIIDDGNKDD